MPVGVSQTKSTPVTTCARFQAFAPQRWTQVDLVVKRMTASGGNPDEGKEARRATVAANGWRALGDSRRSDLGVATRMGFSGGRGCSKREERK